MNLNFCRYKCGKGINPCRIVHFKNGYGGWYLVMNDMDSDGCRLVEIEDASKWMDAPPKGWYNNSLRHDEICMESGNAEEFLWNIALKAGECACPFLAEHTMYDLAHAERKKEWANKESIRKELVERRIERNAEADS